MTYQKIHEWARAGESEQMEFKATTGQRREAARTVCAMLNRHGGHVIFGVDNGRRVVGQQIGQNTLRDIQHELGRIDPPAYPSVSTIEVGPDRGVVVVSVPGGPNRPYSYRGIPYQRVGDTTVEMAGGEYQRILVERLHAQIRWENQPADGWSAADLDHGQIVLTVEGESPGRRSRPPRSVRASGRADVPTRISARGNGQCDLSSGLQYRGRVDRDRRLR